MSTSHDGPVVLKPLAEIADFLRKMIPSNIPESYVLNPALGNVAGEKDIRKGVLAYRDFLLTFFDRLTTDGDVYAAPPKNPKSITDYPFLDHVTNLLFDIGYHGELDDNSILVTKLPTYAPTIDGRGKVKAPKSPVSKLPDCLRFLALCGFSFPGVDISAKRIPDAFLVTYPNAPHLLAGLKAMAIADKVLRNKRYINDDRHDNLLRCDYRALKEEETDALDVLTDTLQALPEQVRGFAVRLHRRYTGMGMTSTVLSSTYEVLISYADIRNSRREMTPKDRHYLRLWEFDVSLRHGYSLVIRAKKTGKYADVIKTFPETLRELIAKGYGCDRKLRNERCQHGCHGFRLPLDKMILALAGDIETWLDHEVSC